MKKLKTLMLLGLSVTMVGLFVGCSSDQSKEQNKEQVKAETRVVSTLKGDVEIPVHPERIVDISGSSEELFILDYKVAGTANIDSYATDRVPSYMEEELGDVAIVGHSMMDTMDMEAILAVEPDLIIMGQRQEKIYDQLAAIAPTVMMKEYNNEWEDKLMDVGTLFGKEAESAKWLEDYKSKAAAIGEEIKAAKGDKTYLALLAGTGGQFFVFSNAGIGSIINEDMGLAIPENLPKQEDISLPVVTLEGLTQINADYMMVIAGEAEKKELEASSVWNELEAVKAGNTIFLDQSPYFTQCYNPIGRLELLEQIKAVIME